MRRSPRLLALVLVIGLPTACGGETSAPRPSPLPATPPATSSGRDLTSLHAHGLSLRLPPEWTGRVVLAENESAEVLRAANFALPDERYAGPETAAAMGPGSIAIDIADLGIVDPQLYVQDGWHATSLPLTIFSTDLGPYQEGYWVWPPGYALRQVLIGERALLVGVGFGTESPSEELIAEANAVLATLELGPPAPETAALPSGRLPCHPGAWPFSPTADWLREVVTTAGLTITGCTGSAFVVDLGAGSVYLWATEAIPPDRLVEETNARSLGTIGETPVFGDTVRGLWQTADLTVWFEPGPRATEPMPSLTALEPLVTASVSADPA